MIFWPVRLPAFPGEVSEREKERESERRREGRVSLAVLSFVLTYRTRHAIESRAFVSIKLRDKRTRRRVHPSRPPRYAPSRSPRYRWRLSILPFHCLHRIIAFLVPSFLPRQIFGAKFLTRDFTLHANYFQHSALRILCRRVTFDISHCKYYKSPRLVLVSS